MKRELHIIQYPSGRWGFVGSVPLELAYVSTGDEPLTHTLVESEHRLPASHRTRIKTRTFETREAAIEAVKILYLSPEDAQLSLGELELYQNFLGLMLGHAASKLQGTK